MALFKPWKIGAAAMRHRVAMAPLTRLRAKGDDGQCPWELNAEYYGQRASEGMNIQTHDFITTFHT